MRVENSNFCQNVKTWKLKNLGAFVGARKRTFLKLLFEFELPTTDTYRNGTVNIFYNSHFLYVQTPR